MVYRSLTAARLASYSLRPMLDGMSGLGKVNGKAWRSLRKAVAVEEHSWESPTKAEENGD